MNVVSLVAELEAMADQFCVQGRVVETGTHSSLLAKAGKYATMWSRQANVDDSSAVELLDDKRSKQE